MKTIVFPGSFDPFTLGHLDLVKRASKITDKLIILVVNTDNKISINKRIELIQKIVDKNNLNNVVVDKNEELLVNYMKKNRFSLILRGIRNLNDYQYEQILEINNKKLFPDLEMIYMFTSPEFLHISSSLVWEIFSYGGNISNLVPQEIKDYLNEEYENI